MFFPFFGSGPVPFLPGGGGGTESSLYIINSKDTSKQNVIRLHPLTPGGGGYISEIQNFVLGSSR